MDDGVNAKLSVGEYVVPADLVALLGDGDNASGAKVLDKALSQLRKTAGIKSGKQPKKLAHGGKVSYNTGGLVAGLMEGKGKNNKVPKSMEGLLRTLGILKG